MQRERPAVRVYTDGSARAAEVLCEVLQGIEEEGIPYHTEHRENDASANAVAAAEESRLGTGIGVSEREVVVHYDKLPPGNPLFRVGTYEENVNFRNLGSNAARLVKRIPFKQVGD